MPEAGILGPGNEYLAPTIWALMNGTEKLAKLSLQDCNHQWWCDPRTYRWDEADAAEKMCNEYKENTQSTARSWSWAFGQGRAHTAAPARATTASTTAADAPPYGAQNAHRLQL